MRKKERMLRVLPIVFVSFVLLFYRYVMKRQNGDKVDLLFWVAGVFLVLVVTVVLTVRAFLSDKTPISEMRQRLLFSLKGTIYVIIIGITARKLDTTLLSMIGLTCLELLLMVFESKTGMDKKPNPKAIRTPWYVKARTRLAGHSKKTRRYY